MPELTTLLTWKLFAIISFLFFGLQNYLYKVIVNLNLNSKTVTYVYVSISCIITSMILIIKNDNLFTNFTYFTMLIAACDSLAYYCTTISRIEALKYVPSTVSFPIARFSTVLIVLYGICILGEPLSQNLLYALMLCALLVCLVTIDRKHSKLDYLDYNKGIVLSFIAMITSAATNIISKYAALYSDPLVYMTLANLLIAISMKTLQTKNKTPFVVCKKTLIVAFTISIVNLVAWFSYLYALQTGPLSVVSTISSLAFVVPIVLALLIDKEKLSMTKFLIAILPIILIFIL